MEHLAPELFVKILSYFDPADCCVMATVSTQWNEVFSSDAVWKEMVARANGQAVVAIKVKLCETDSNWRDMYRFYHKNKWFVDTQSCNIDDCRQEFDWGLQCILSAVLNKVALPPVLLLWFVSCQRGSKSKQNYASFHELYCSYLKKFCQETCKSLNSKTGISAVMELNKKWKQYYLFTHHLDTVLAWLSEHIYRQSNEALTAPTEAVSQHFSQLLQEIREFIQEQLSTLTVFEVIDKHELFSLNKLFLSFELPPVIPDLVDTSEHTSEYIEDVKKPLSEITLLSSDFKRIKTPLEPLMAYSTVFKRIFSTPKQPF